MTMTLGNICAGFEKSGIYPFNPQAVKLMKKEALILVRGSQLMM